MSATKKTTKPAKHKTTSSKTNTGLSAEEIAAMKEALKERKAAASKEEAEKAVLDKIATMPQPDRGISERLHALIKANAPHLLPRTWYGMPAYANKDGKVVVFFRDTQKFNERYMTFGFNPEANVDEGTMWPVAYALTDLTAADEKKIGALVKKAVS